MAGIEIRRIVCPTDFSASSEAALRVSVALAERDGAQLKAVHVVPPRLPPPGRGSPCLTPLVVEAQDPCPALERLSTLLDPALARAVAAEAVVLQGDAAEHILAEVRGWAADLVVLAVHGERGPREWAVGSVTARLLRKAPCPVLLVPTGVRAPDPSELFRRLLCPVDFSQLARTALDHALSLARRSHGLLTLLHVLEWFPGTERDEAHLNIPEYRIDLAEVARDRLRGLVPEGARDGCECEEIVAIGQPHRQILRVARERGMDLIVLAVHGRRGLDRTLFGSTVCHVIREARCPVLAIRPD